MKKKKKEDIIKLDKEYSFDELMQHIANVKAEDVDELMRQAESNDAPIEESPEECEPPQQC